MKPLIHAIIPFRTLDRPAPAKWAFAVLLMIAISSFGRAAEVTPERARNLVVLDAKGVENLRLKTTTADEQTFEQVFFAAGRVDSIPTSRAAVSSLLPGRVVELKVAAGDAVKEGAEVAVIETVRGADITRESLTAPIAGIVQAVHVTRGAAFRRATTLIEIVDLREVDVIARVPEHEASLLGPGSSARIRVLSACDKIFKGTLVRFGTEGDRKHGTVEAYYRLANRDLLMRPGMRAEFRIIAAERKVSAVPREAVQGNSAGPFVFIKDYELPNAFVRTPVVTGQRNDRFVEIVSGLMPGDEVVTTGAYALSSAGRGPVNLREALDAAHGHAHDDEGKPVSGRDAAGPDAHDHDEHRSTVTPATLFLGVLSVLLLGLLLLSRRHPPAARA